MKLQELYQLKPQERIKELKKSPATRPSTQQLLKDWDYTQHEVFNQEIRKKRKVLVEDAVLNLDGSVKTPARYEMQEVNRIALPLEQDIVNIHTAFTVGTSPEIICNPQGENQKALHNQLLKIHAQSKLNYQNKRLVRAWLSECEVAEYWFVKPSEENFELKSVIWSPFKGDSFYPYYDEYGDLIAFSREYQTKDEYGKSIQKLMVIDNQQVSIYAENELIEQYPHGFSKIPVIYMSRPTPLCDRIRTKRARLETLLSNFADCLDYNFYPKLVATGDLEGIQNKGTTNEIIQLQDGGQVAYLTWQQSPEMARLEFDNLINYCYSLTNTPRISFENLKGTGSALSGTAFKYVFMGTHLEVSNHAEVVEEFLQRRVNFLLSAIATFEPKFLKEIPLLNVEIKIVPYLINNQSERIADAVNALSGGVASLENALILAGITDHIHEEKQRILKDKNTELFSN